MEMRIIESCAECLYDKQAHRCSDSSYLARVKEIIETRKPEDTSPYLVYLFNLEYEKRFGKKSSYSEVKKKYNDLLLSMEQSFREKIEAAKDPLLQALLYARIGNYIDVAAMNVIKEETLMELFENVQNRPEEEEVICHFLADCEKARRFLLIADNCGEIVLDKLFLEQLRKRFPDLAVTVLVRGEEVLNDATLEDAKTVGLDRVAHVIGNGLPIAGTVYTMLPDETKQALDQADVILAKGQGNYESLSRQGRHIYFSFLCKCELFTNRFSAPLLTGIFCEERE
ncbi:MAG: DUF89 family protein [Clostridiales bacterium]|nr:DUF89 family protein [Clostridiales bacterium]